MTSSDDWYFSKYVAAKEVYVIYSPGVVRAIEIKETKKKTSEILKFVKEYKFHEGVCPPDKIDIVTRYTNDEDEKDRLTLPKVKFVIDTVLRLCNFLRAETFNHFVDFFLIPFTFVDRRLNKRSYIFLKNVKKIMEKRLGIDTRVKEKIQY